MFCVIAVVALNAYSQSYGRYSSDEVNEFRLSSWGDLVLPALFLLFIVYAVYVNKKNPNHEKDENRKQEEEIKEEMRISEQYWKSHANDSTDAEMAIIICPNCKSKYKVPKGKHLEIACKQKNCLYKWKTFT